MARPHPTAFTERSARFARRCSRADACQFGPFACPLHPVSARPGPTRPLTCGGAKDSAGEHA
eukprot:scaffold57505_cov30-Phaeocystis_antarctica.AAC.1